MNIPRWYSGNKDKFTWVRHKVDHMVHLETAQMLSPLGKGFK